MFSNFRIFFKFLAKMLRLHLRPILKLDASSPNVYRRSCAVLRCISAKDPTHERADEMSPWSAFPTPLGQQPPPKGALLPQERQMQGIYR